MPILAIYVFFFNDTATTEIYTLSLHDALPIWRRTSRDLSTTESLEILPSEIASMLFSSSAVISWDAISEAKSVRASATLRSEEHTSELQSRQYLVCRLLLEKKKKSSIIDHYSH